MVVEDFVSSRSGNLQIKIKLHQREDSRTLVFVADKWKTRQTPDSNKIPLVRALNCIILQSPNHENPGRFEVEGVRRNHEDLVIFEGTPLNGTVGKRIVGENSSNIHQRYSRILRARDASSPIQGPPGSDPVGHK
jgi:hypothetical protein